MTGIYYTELFFYEGCERVEEGEKNLLRYSGETDSPLPDVETVRRAIDGDKEAFGELFQCTYRRMFFVARRILSRDEDIYDALQTAYSKAYKYLGRVSPPENFYAWLTKIVENSAKDVWRDLHPNEELSTDVEVQPAPDIAEDADRRVLLGRVLQEMDSRRAEVLTMYYYDGLKLSEIAKILGEPISTVHSRLKAAKRELTNLLESRGIDRSFYSGGFFSAIAVALRSVLGTDILSAAVAQKMMDEVMTGRPGRLDAAAAILAKKQRNKAILRIATLLMVLVIVVTLLTSAIANGWFFRRTRETTIPATTTTVFGGASATDERTTTTAQGVVTENGDETVETTTADTTVSVDGTTSDTPTSVTEGTTSGSSATVGTSSTTRGSTSDAPQSAVTTTTTRTERPTTSGTTRRGTTKLTATETTTNTTKKTQEATKQPTTTKATTVTQFADITSKLTFIATGGEATITDCDTSVSGAIEVPAYLGGVPVSIISNDAFRSCKEITAIKFPDTLTEIGGSAFADCNALQEVVLPDSVKTVGRDAFRSCTSLHSIVVGAGVTSFHKWALKDCLSLESITVKSGNTAYSGKNNCLIETSTKTLLRATRNSTIPNDGSVTRIGENAFLGLSNLQSVNIPRSIARIDGNQFDKIENLYIEDITAWCGVSFASSLADGNPMWEAENVYFDGVKVTGKLVIPSDVTVIKMGTFYGCPITTLEISEGVTEIQKWTLVYSDQLVKVSLPKSLKRWISVRFSNARH